MGSRLEIPGLPPGMAVEQGTPTLAALNQMTQILAQLHHLVDLSLQVQLRIGVGWTPRDIVTDMGLNVPPSPDPARRTELQELREKLAEDQRVI